MEELWIVGSNAGCSLLRAVGPEDRLLATCCSGCAAGRCPEDARSNPREGNTRRRCGSRRPAVPVAGRAAVGVRCLVPHFLLATYHVIDCVDQKTTRTRHATHPPAVPMVEGDAEGGGGGDLANGPLDGRTNRGSNPRRRRTPAHGTYHYRPSMPLALYSVKVLQIQRIDSSEGKQNR